MTAEWVASLNDLSNVCKDNIHKELDLYRKSLIDKGVSNVTAMMEYPPRLGDLLQGQTPMSVYASLVPLNNDVTAISTLYHPVSLEFPTLSSVAVGWVNSVGDHLYADRPAYYGVYDSNVNINMTYYFFDTTGKPTNIRAGGDIVHYVLTTRSWWKVGLGAVNGSWTSVYHSQNMLEGRLIAYLKRVRTTPDLTVVIQITYTLESLALYFRNFNITATGKAFLTDDSGPLILIAGSVGVTTGTPSGGDLSALNSTDVYVSGPAQQWVSINKGEHAAASFVYDGHVYVDVAAIRASGGLTMWFWIITPQEDFLDPLTKGYDRSVNNAYVSLWTVLSVEAVVGLVGISLSCFLSVFLARTLRNVIRKLQNVSAGKFSRSSSTNLQRSFVTEIDALNKSVVTMQTALSSFSKYVPTQIVRYLCKHQLQPVLGVCTMDCCVIFIDVVDFTKKMDLFGAGIIIEVLGLMFEEFSTIITNNGGTIDKYIGDAIMGLFGKHHSNFFH
eukprot:TRINITY_DN5105_c0_g1_i6.p1 TRINITY_DN5105_c0_g1~~TRINITY_DN5105_c0_g1_i6.p1  ORF type:complete len:500 (+),score=99.75 TRINITY_DN5105_c0_g1_i6:362-1861(+)